MSVVLTVNGNSFNYPVKKDEQWGVDATNWAIAVTDALSSVVTAGDIASPDTALTIFNGQASPINVTGLAFDSSVARGAEIEYSVYRSRGSDEVAEQGVLEIVYLSTANVWSLSREATPGTDTTDCGVTFTITTSGQVQYTSTTFGTTGSYVGLLQFRARITKVS